MSKCHQILGYASAVLFAASAQANSSIDESRGLVPDGLVQVENLAGSIDITVWDRAGVHIGGDLGDDVEELEITESSSGIPIRVRNRNNQRHVDESLLRLQVPATASIEAEGISADISVTGLQGSSLVLNSVSGDIDLQGIEGEIRISTVSGDVHLVLPAAQQVDCTAQTYSGRIRSDFGSVKGGSYGPGKTFSFLAGNNGATIKIESFSGDVKINQH